MLRKLQLAAVIAVVAVGSVAVPTLLASKHTSSSPYVSAIEKAAMPVASAVQCNQWECVRVGAGKACYEEFEFAHWCTTTIDGNGNPSCLGTYNCDL